MAAGEVAWAAYGVGGYNHGNPYPWSKMQTQPRCRRRHNRRQTRSYMCCCTPGLVQEVSKVKQERRGDEEGQAMG